MGLTIMYYVRTWHDMEHDGNCFDEDKFYNVENLSDYLKSSKESIDNNYCDQTRVWIVLSDGQLIEIVDVER